MTIAAETPENEPARLARLRALAILDTGPETIFDTLTGLAADICGVPIALVSLIDTDRQWFKSSVGLDGVTETPREMAFCAHAILNPGVMEVRDALADDRFARNPLVTGDPSIRFYAGAPIALSDGVRVGTLCAIGRKPQQLSDHQISMLRQLAAVASQALEFRERAIRGLADAARNTEKLNKLYTATPALLFSFDSEARLLTVSDAWEAELGYAREEVLGRHVMDFFAPASRQEIVQNKLGELWREGHCDDVELQMVRKDGSIVDVLASGTVMKDGSDAAPRCVAVITNITLRRRAERALAKNEALYRALVEDQTEMVCLIMQDRSLGFVNTAFAQFFGQDQSGMVGKDIFDYIPEANRPATAAFLSKVLQSPDVVQSETRNRGLDGQERVLAWKSRAVTNEVGQITAVHSVGRDITEHKRTMEALQTSQRFLRRTGEVAGVGGWELDLVTGDLTWSDETCRLHDLPPGYRPTVEEGIAYYAPEARPVIERLVREGIEQGRPWDVELPFISAKGRAFWARAAGSAEFENGKPIRLVGAFQDVTQRKQMEDELVRNRQSLQVTLDSIGDAVITTDINGRVQWLNPVAERMTGWLKADAYGKPLQDVFLLVDEQTRKLAENPVSLCLARGELVGLGHHTVLISLDGYEYGIEDSASPIRDEAGQIHGAVWVFRDVSEQRRLSSEMSHRATHDVLTGLVNRGEFESRLERLLARIKDDHSSNALMYIDLDEFKVVNDTCGHSAGDLLLRQVSKLLQNCVRGSDTVARLGGDEFGVILEYCDIAKAQTIAQAICDQMEEFRFQHDGRRFRIGTSIGLVPVDAHWSGLSAVLQAADTSCYAAKEAGRNRVHLWFETDHAMKRRHGETRWVSRLEQALDEDRFELYGQRIEPIGGTSDSVDCEILLRLRNGDGTLTLPGAFLPAAERFHLATRIDRWVLRHVFDWMEKTTVSAQRIGMISVNLSGQSIGDRAFHRDVGEMIARARFDLSKLCLEITETSAITKLDDAAAFIKEVRAMGVKIALDDFGAGASSFGYLKTLPVDFLKIDGQFITHILEDELDFAAVRCFHDVAKVLGVKTIAEFIECQEVRVALERIGIDFAQGYLIHRPEPLDTLFGVTRAPIAARPRRIVQRAAS